MATGSRKTIPLSASPDSLQPEVERVLHSGLADFSLRELLGCLISSLGQAERQAYLNHHRQDKANGFYPRSLAVGSIPVDIEVPRTRTGQFRPETLPAPYQRGYPEQSQALWLGLLASSRSLSAARDALRKMGLSRSQQDLDTVAASLIEELDLRNSRPFDPDLLALFCDGKYVEIKDGDRLRSACIYLVVGLGRDGKKRVLTCLWNPTARTSPIGSWSCAASSSAACAGFCWSFTTTSPACCPSPKACSRAPMSSCVWSTCNATPNTTCPKPTAASFNNAGAP